MHPDWINSVSWLIWTAQAYLGKSHSSRTDDLFHSLKRKGASFQKKIFSLQIFFHILLYFAMRNPTNEKLSCRPRSAIWYWKKGRAADHIQKMKTKIICGFPNSFDPSFPTSDMQGPALSHPALLLHSTYIGVSSSLMKSNITSLLKKYLPPLGQSTSREVNRWDAVRKSETNITAVQSRWESFAHILLHCSAQAEQIELLVVSGQLATCFLL